MRRASRVHEQEHNLHQIRKSLLCQKILHTQLFKDLVSSKVSLKNYEGLTNLHEHIQNIKSILKLITQDNDVVCKVLLATLYGSTRAWYHSLEFVFILHFRDFNSKLISSFNISILAKKKKHHKSLPCHKKGRWEHQSLSLKGQRGNAQRGTNP
jgi:hypothetical protein